MELVEPAPAAAQAFELPRSHPVEVDEISWSDWELEAAAASPALVCFQVIPSRQASKPCNQLVVPWSSRSPVLVLPCQIVCQGSQGFQQ